MWRLISTKAHLKNRTTMNHNSNIDALHPPLRQAHIMPSCFSHGSLFSGIGGFDLAAQWMGWNNIFQVEKDDWCRKVLAKNFPKTERFSDIKDFIGYEYTNRIDVISGGFPCQPFSVAGQRKGKDDDRYLWEEMLRVIATIKPKYVVGENVTGIIGLALDTVLSDLEAQNYTTETFIIPACSKNAWHRRDRVWIVAYANSIGRQDEQKENGKSLCNGERNNTIEEQSREQQQCRTGKSSTLRNATNCNLSGFEKQREQITNETEHFAPKCGSWWKTEPGVGRVADGIPNRVDRIKGLGNAIVPQVALTLFEAISEAGSARQKKQ
jgi:DNA (cytosine-5)-methyltransferase 1